jgi:hypothetical protein
MELKSLNNGFIGKVVLCQTRPYLIYFSILCFSCRLPAGLNKRPCLVLKKFCKIVQILRHIESLDACMEY